MSMSCESDQIERMCKMSGPGSWETVIFDEYVLVHANITQSLNKILTVRVQRNATLWLLPVEACYPACDGH